MPAVVGGGVMSNESAIHQKAKRNGYCVFKSRQHEHYDNHGLFQLVDSYNYVVLGRDYDATLEDILDFLNESAAA
jgi:hypothetical protein